VGKVAPQVVARDGQAVIQNRVSLTLSVDHRVANGRYAAAFLAKIVEELEDAYRPSSSQVCAAVRRIIHL
jgi:pyruvate/2-oxoglutarate dehydrogenase complex dihydrolipoamide acyltransferase (E2) component